MAAAGLFGWVIAREQQPQAVTEFMLSLTDNPLVFLLLINIALLITGMLLTSSGLLITVRASAAASGVWNRSLTLAS